MALNKTGLTTWPEGTPGNQIARISADLRENPADLDSRSRPRLGKAWVIARARLDARPVGAEPARYQQPTFSEFARWAPRGLHQPITWSSGPPIRTTDRCAPAGGRPETHWLELTDDLHPIGLTVVHERKTPPTISWR